jgi:hypothetical protein
MEDLINIVRRQRDEAASTGDHAEVLILNDIIKVLKNGGEQSEALLVRSLSILAKTQKGF